MLSRLFAAAKWEIFTRKLDDSTFLGILMGTGRDLLRFLFDETLAGFPLIILQELEAAVLVKKKKASPLALLHNFLGKMVAEIQVGCLEHLRIVRVFVSLMSRMVAKIVDLILPRKRPPLVAG